MGLARATIQPISNVRVLGAQGFRQIAGHSEKVSPFQCAYRSGFEAGLFSWGVAGRTKAG